MLLIGAFLSYSTLPYIFGLSFIFLLKKNYFKFFIFNTAGFLYVLFYFYVFLYLQLADTKISENLTFVFFIKNFIMSFFSAIDALIGPSFFYKIYLSILCNSFLSLGLCLISTLYFFKFFKNFKQINFYNIKILFICFFIIFVTSLLIYSLTGQYFQTPFNLGNRVTIYGSLLFSLFFVQFFKNKYLLFIFLFVFNLSLMGMSNHWKNWSDSQSLIIYKINNNSQLTDLKENDIILVSGNLYSKMGTISHIEFLVQPWVVKSLFEKQTKTIKIIPLTSYLEVKNNYIINLKYKTKTFIDGEIYLYDSNLGELKILNKNNISTIINSQPKEIRHIIQLLNFKILNNFILFLNSRLSYIF